MKRLPAYLAIALLISWGGAIAFGVSSLTNASQLYLLQLRGVSEKQMVVVEVNATGRPISVSTVIEVDDDVNPTPVPIPGELAIAVVYESKTRTPQQSLMLKELQTYLTNQNYFWRMVDKDLVDGTTGQTPKWLAPILPKADVKTGPVIAVGKIQDGVFSVVDVSDTQTTSASAIQYIKKFEDQP